MTGLCPSARHQAMRSRGGPWLGRLEQLDHIARRILAEDLLAARTFDDVVAEFDALTAQVTDLCREIFHLENETIPATGFGLAPVGHGARGRGLRARDPQRQIAMGQDRHGGPELLAE